MKVHILVSEYSGVRNVQCFPSRLKMTQAAKDLETKFTMFPPVYVPRKQDGILYIADLVNRIHLEGEEQILMELEALEEYDDID